MAVVLKLSKRSPPETVYNGPAITKPVKLSALVRMASKETAMAKKKKKKVVKKPVSKPAY